MTIGEQIPIPTRAGSSRFDPIELYRAGKQMAVNSISPRLTRAFESTALIVCAAAGGLAGLATIGIGGAPSLPSTLQIPVAVVALVLWTTAIALAFRNLGLVRFHAARILGLEANLVSEVARTTAEYGAIDACVTILDRDGIVLRQTDRSTAFLGRYPWELTGQSFSTIFGDDLRPRVASWLAAAAIHGSARSPRFERAEPIGRWLYLQIRRIEGGGFTVTTTECSDLVQAEAERDYARATDPVTDLPNRPTFLAQVSAHLTRGRSGVLVAIDLDKFGDFRCAHGEIAGDAVLRVIAHRLRRELGRDDAVGRLGSDQFGLLLSGASSAADLPRLLKAIVDRPISLDTSDHQIRAHCGYRTLEPGISTDRALADTESALHLAQHLKTDSPVAWSERVEVDSWIPTPEEFADALDRDQLLLHYQPIVQLASSDVVEMEALLRWNHPERGMLLPGEFLPFLRSDATMIRLGWWTIDCACRQGAIWLNQCGARAPIVAVNVSATLLAAPDLVQRLRDSLNQHKFPGTLLRLELVEHERIGDLALAADRLTSIRALGIQVAIDDFGTGYSSLAWLNALPIDVIKIDRTFVSAIESDTHTREIVRSIIDLARRLDISTTGEGIETYAQLARLRELGSDCGQGFLFARPMAACDCRVPIDPARTAA